MRLLLSECDFFSQAREPARCVSTKPFYGGNMVRVFEAWLERRPCRLKDIIFSRGFDVFWIAVLQIPKQFFSFSSLRNFSSEGDISPRVEIFLILAISPKPAIQSPLNLAETESTCRKTPGPKGPKCVIFGGRAKNDWAGSVFI